jgi:hypothetical protein
MREPLFASHKELASMHEPRATNEQAQCIICPSPLDARHDNCTVHLNEYGPLTLDACHDNYTVDLDGIEYENLEACPDLKASEHKKTSVMTTLHPTSNI